MIGYIQQILGTYVPLQGEGIASLNIEYIVGAITLIMTLWLFIKLTLFIITVAFGHK